MVPSQKRRQKHWMLRVFRWCRIAVLCVIFGLLAGVIHLSVVGFPGWMREALVAQFTEQGLSVGLTRLHLGLNGGAMAEGVRITVPGRVDVPVVTADRLEFHVGWRALMRREISLERISLRGGRLSWDLASGTNHPPRAMVISNLVCEVGFPTGHADVWEVDRMGAVLPGLKLSVTAGLTNVADWFRVRAVEPGEVGKRSVPVFVTILDEVGRVAVVDAALPDLSILVQGDARQPSTFNGLFTLRSRGFRVQEGGHRVGPATVTGHWEAAPGGSGRASLRWRLEAGESSSKAWGLHASKVLAHAAGEVRVVSDGLVWDSVDWNLAADGLSGPDWRSRSVTLSGHSVPEAEGGVFWRSELKASVEGVLLPWGRGESGGVDLRLRHRLDGLAGAELAGRVEAKSWVGQSGGRIGQVGLDLKAQAVEGGLSEGSWWEKWRVTGQLEASRLGGWWKHLQIDSLSSGFEGGVHGARFRDIRVRLGAAELLGDASWDERLGRLETGWVVETDPIGLAVRVLGEAGVPAALRDRVRLDGPVAMKVRGVLPLRMEGGRVEWKVGDGSGSLSLVSGGGNLAGVPFERISVDAGWDGDRLRLDRAWLRQGPGAECVVKGVGGAAGFEGSLDGSLDVMGLLGILEPGLKATVGQYLGFRGSVTVQGALLLPVWDVARLGFDGRVEVPGVRVRSEWFDRLSAWAVWTNGVVTATNVVLDRVPGERATVKHLVYDTVAGNVRVSGAESTLNPYRFATALGPESSEALDPYRFTLPPHAKINGVYDLRRMEGTDLLFDVEGGEFRWWRVVFESVRGKLRWHGWHVQPHDLSAVLHGGTVEGAADFMTKTTGPGAEFNATLKLNGVELGKLMQTLTLKTNRHSGAVTGTLEVASGNTSDATTWEGRGQAELRDGFLWDIPLFGIFTPMMEVVSPGLGRTKVSAATATYVLRKGLVRSEDLEVRSGAMRLQMKGEAGVDGKLNATAVAELWRDSGAVGRVFGLAMTPFTRLLEYRITGTLENPKEEPLYIPRLFLAPIHPFRTIREWTEGGGEDGSGREKKAAGGGKTPGP